MNTQRRAPFNDQLQVSETRYDGPLPVGILDRIHNDAMDYGLPVTRITDGLALTRGEAAVVIRTDENGFSVEISAPTHIMLHQARDSVIYLLDHIVPAISANLQWSGTASERSFPPNFQIAMVCGIEHVGGNFIRVHMACDAVETLCVGGMHFSLLLPPAGRVPVWPILNDRMRTVWPADADTLHRAAYTFVAIDPVSGRFSFDIFAHAGGRTTDWAQRVTGGEVVGIMGPGSGDFPITDDLLIAGDETALPAIRRILEQSPPTRHGHAVIEVGDPADIVPITVPPLMTLDWILRGPDQGLCAQLLNIDHLPPETFVWVAAEQATIRQVKAHFKTLGLARDKSYISYYWTR